MSEQIIIVNPNSNNAKKVIRYLKSKDMQYYLVNELQKKINQGNKDFVICGGDGTINQFVNLIMKFPKKERDSIKIGIIPCGRANDLARYMKIPLDIDTAFEKMKERNEKKIDLIRINEDYVITGGGIGLPSETVQEIDSFSSSFLGKYLKKTLGDFSYLLFTLKKFIFGYDGVEVLSRRNSNKLLAIYVLNQPFIGKRFNIAPKAKNSDGFLDIVFVENPTSYSSRFKTLSKGIKGHLADLSWVKEKKARKLSIALKKPLSFMGDGELLKPSNKMTIEIIPRTITIYH